MYCKNCGNELPENAVFCGKCGVKVENAVSDVNKKSAFTKKHMIMITAFGCILIFAIIMVVLFWKKPSQDTDAVAENTTESIEESTQIEETVAVTAETEEISEELEEVELQYYLASETRYCRGFIESVSEYDSEGNVVKNISYDEDGSITSRIESEYDSAGNRVSCVSYNGDGSVADRSEYEYDSAGNQVSFMFYNGDGSVRNRSESEYDSAGNQVSYVFYNGDGSVRNRSESEYDSAGNQVSYVSYNGDGSVAERSEWEYDSAGNQVGYVSYNEDGSVNYRTERGYDSVGNQVGYVSYNGDGSVAEKIESEYDGAGNEVSRVSYNGDGSVNYRTERGYDSAGNIVSCVSYDGDGGVRTRSEYDSVGNQVSYVFYNGDGSVAERDQWEYDSDGNEISYIVYNEDGSITSRIEREYDNAGNQVAYVFYNGDGSVTSRIENEYEYDENGNLIKEEAHYYSENGEERDFTEIIYEYKLLEEFENLSEAEGSHRDELITEDVTCEEAFEDCILENALQEQEAVGNPDELQYLYFYHDFNRDNNDELVLKKTNYYSEDTIYIYSVIGGQVTLLLEREDGTYYEEFNALTENGFVISGTVTNGAEYHYYVYSMNDNEVNQTAEMHSYEYEGWSDDACNEYEIVIEDEEYYTKDAEEYNDKLNQYLEENIVTNIPYNSPIWIELCDDILE